MQRQRAVVGGDGFVVAALARQRVGQVVPARITVDALELLARSGEVARAIGLHAVGQALVLQLVGALPQRALRWRRSGRWSCLRLHIPHPWQQAHRQHCGQQRAAAEGEQRQQHHRWQQPESFIAPLPALAGPLRRSTFACIKHTQCAQVTAIGGDARIATATCRGHRTQATFVQRSLADLSAVVTIRRTRRCTEPQHRHLQAEPTCLRGRQCSFTIGLIGDQQDLSLRCSDLPHQPRGPVDATVGTLAITRHHIRRQGIQIQRDVAAVIGQRRDGVGIFGVHHQPHLPTLACAQELADLGPCLQQARRWQVGGSDAAGQIQHDQQRCAGLEHRLCLLPPARPRHRQCCQRPTQQHCQWQPHATASTGRQQMRQQVRIHRLPPRIAAPLPVQRHGENHRQGQQGPQPFRAQEVQCIPVGKMGCQRDHRRRSGHTHANAPSSKARPNGHA